VVEGGSGVSVHGVMWPWTVGVDMKALTFRAFSAYIWQRIGGVMRQWRVVPDSQRSNGNNGAAGVLAAQLSLASQPVLCPQPLSWGEWACALAMVRGTCCSGYGVAMRLLAPHCHYPA